MIRDIRSPGEVKNDPDAMEEAIRRDTMNLGEPETVRRTNLNTGFHRDIPMSEAVAEIAAKASADQFNSRMDIVSALCEGRAIEAGTYSYKVRP